MTIAPVETFARVGNFAYVYAEAVEKNYAKYLRISEEIKKFGNIEYDDELLNLKQDHQIAGLQTIVFSSMCFEAAIFDFASIHLGDDYVRNHLDKLDVLSKWVLVLRFVSGIELLKDEAPYGTLKNLIAARNNLVHAKSEIFNCDGTKKQFEKIQKKVREFEANVHNAFKALVVMSTYLECMQKDHHNPLPSYNNENAPMRRFYKELSDVIGDCRQIASKINGS